MICRRVNHLSRAFVYTTMDHGFGFVPHFSDLRVIFQEFHQKCMEIDNFQVSCNNQKENKGVLRWFPAADAWSLRR